MLVGKSEWWTNERIESTVTAHYIYSHLSPDEAEKLTIRVFATFSNDTYLEWILLKGKRLFLALVDAGISGQIFRLIDESYDDDDLPIAEEDVPSLRLPQGRGASINQLFYRCQFRYLFRVINEGEHIRYAKPEIIPVQALQQKQLQLVHADDKVVISPNDQRVFSRKVIHLAEDRAEVDVLSEIASLKALNFEHIVSVFGSYASGDQVCVLLQSLGKNNLKSFLNDTPKAFSALPKLERRVHLLSWANCLSNALAWLHMQNAHHGAIRPSRIHIDDDLRPCLGQFEGDGVLGQSTSKDDLEAYQYAAPEFWKRELTLSSRVGSNARSDRSSHSRVGHRNRSDSLYDSVDVGETQSNFTYAFMPTSKGNPSRLKLETWNRRKEKPVTSSIPHQQRAPSRTGATKEASKPYNSLHQHFDSLSLRSTNSSENGRKTASTQGKALYYIAAESRHAVIQTWKSSVSDPAAADIFALAAVIMELLTMLCSRTTSAFSKHRASKNRQAGRGGGMADSSFHANLPQVASWAEALHKEAEKRIKKPDGAIFKATGPILQILIHCLDREPSRRMNSQSLAKRLQKDICEFAGLTKLHCNVQVLEDKKKEKITREMELEEIMMAEGKSATPSYVSTVSHNAPTVSRGLEDFEYDDPQPLRRQSVQLPESSMKKRSPRYFGESRGLTQDKSINVPARLRLDIAEQSPSSSIEYRERVTIEPSEDGSGDESPPQSIYSGSRSTGTFMHEKSEPTTPSTMSASFKTANQYANYYSQSPPESKPPSRGLPPVPPIPANARSTPASTAHGGERSSASKRRHGAPILSPVDHATNLLAQTLNGKEYDDAQRFEMHPGDRLRLTSQYGKYSRTNDILEEDEDEVGGYYPSVKKISSSSNFRPARVGR